MSTEKDPKEQRRYRRILVSASVRYAPRQFGSNIPPDLWEGRVVNISRSGAALKLSQRLHSGGLVEMAIIQSDPPRCLGVVGKVIRCEPMLEIDSADPNKTPLTCYLVAVEFTRTLDLEELSQLRPDNCLYDTVAEERISTETPGP